jgi:hypothetical protein
MRYTVLFSIFLFAVLTGCKKDKYKSTPSLTFKSVSSTRVPPGSLVQFTLTFTDAEGDVNGSIYIQEIVPGCAGSTRSEVDSIPSFPTSKNQKGDIVVTIGNNPLNGAYENFSPQCPPQNDTAVFRFAIKDKANHISDTVSSPPIIIYHQ